MNMYLITLLCMLVTFVVTAVVFGKIHTKHLAMRLTAEQAEQRKYTKVRIDRFEKALEKAKIPNAKLHEENRMLGRQVDLQIHEIRFLTTCITNVTGAIDMEERANES